MIVMYLQTIACDAHYNYDLIVYYLFIAAPPLLMEGPIIHVLICS